MFYPLHIKEPHELWKFQWKGRRTHSTQWIRDYILKLKVRDPHAEVTLIPLQDEWKRIFFFFEVGHLAFIDPQVSCLIDSHKHGCHSGAEWSDCHEGLRVSFFFLPTSELMRKQWSDTRSSRSSHSRPRRRTTYGVRVDTVEAKTTHRAEQAQTSYVCTDGSLQRGIA